MSELLGDLPDRTSVTPATGIDLAQETYASVTVLPRYGHAIRYGICAKTPPYELRSQSSR
jgi:hypothetical protein